MDLIRRVPMLFWFLAVTMVLLVAGVWFFTQSSAFTKKEEDPTKPIAVSRPVEGVEEFSIVARTHISENTPGSGYNSDPPTSGVHWPSPAKNGIYDKPLEDEQAIHNLEHGYIWVAYKSDVGDDVKNKLKEIVDSDSWKIVMAPRDKNDKPIVLVAWGRYLKMDSLDETKVKDFIRTYRNRGPENTPE